MAGTGYEVLLERLARRSLTRRALLRGGGAIGATTLAAISGLAYPPAWVAAAATPSGPPKRGGTIRYANVDTLKPLSDPATVDALGPSDAVRGAAEFLTYVDEHNLPHPYLLESLEAAPDLKTWTLVVRRGPIFNTPTPRPIDADDVGSAAAYLLSQDARNALYRSVAFSEARQSADWIHINAASYIGPNRWYDAGAGGAEAALGLAG